ncbi:prion-inhibition and propagation-domain-containing protein [Lasiosphaeris hirsuta]|uniref:Prion-inhibition and propagation-domain-containing protein n=1 Tax=Lasiosphaeris hirsuta TaxID=260670 RepID=A0AA40AHH1_9PEZI|nr:prion-inhibition and propagation-domain-containing protein [Lasiosphaeris hirsuta]
MEVVGLVVGTLGLAGLVKACIDNFELVARARGFREDFDILYDQLALQQTRLRIWGRAMGLAPGDGQPTATARYRAAIGRSDVRPTIEANLHNLRKLLHRAEVIAGRYSLPEHGSVVVSGPRSGLGSMLRARLRQTRLGSSFVTATRWSLLDQQKLEAVVGTVKRIIDGLMDITNALGLLYPDLLGAASDRLRYSPPSAGPPSGPPTVCLTGSPAEGTPPEVPSFFYGDTSIPTF